MDSLVCRFQCGVADAVAAAVILHLCPHWACTNVLHIAAFLVPKEDIPCVIVINHAHIRFFVQVVAASVHHLRNLGAIALFPPQIIKSVPGASGRECGRPFHPLQTDTYRFSCCFLLFRQILYQHTPCRWFFRQGHIPAFIPVQRPPLLPQAVFKRAFFKTQNFYPSVSPFGGQ